MSCGSGFGISSSCTQVCAKGSQLCGSQCFNPSTSSCMSCGSGFGISSSCTQVCAKGSQLCGSQCFNPLTSSCMSCGSGCVKICPKGIRC